MRAILLSVLTLSAVTLTAQTATFTTSAKDEIAANHYLAGSNYLDYDRQLPTTPLTPTPKGYEPYYMSHYGRHGSRWLIGEGDYRHPLTTLREARDEGKLTAIGLETLKKLEDFYPTTVKRLGDLTTVGERQHHGIGRRMVEHFPEIFKSKNVPIDAKSTVVIRCILSMENALQQLLILNPHLTITHDASQHDMYYMNQDDPELWPQKTEIQSAGPFQEYCNRHDRSGIRLHQPRHHVSESACRRKRYRQCDQLSDRLRCIQVQMEH